VAGPPGPGQGDRHPGSRLPGCPSAGRPGCGRGGAGCASWTAKPPGWPRSLDWAQALQLSAPRAGLDTALRPRRGAEVPGDADRVAPSSTRDGVADGRVGIPARLPCGALAGLAGSVRGDSDPLPGLVGFTAALRHAGCRSPRTGGGLLTALDELDVTSKPRPTGPAADAVRGPGRRGPLRPRVRSVVERPVWAPVQCRIGPRTAPHSPAHQGNDRRATPIKKSGDCPLRVAATRGGGTAATATSPSFAAEREHLRALLALLRPNRRCAPRAGARRPPGLSGRRSHPARRACATTAIRELRAVRPAPATQGGAADRRVRVDGALRGHPHAVRARGGAEDAGAGSGAEVFTIGTGDPDHPELRHRGTRSEHCRRREGHPGLVRRYSAWATRSRLPRRWASAVAAGPVVVIFSDGWERGEPTLLADSSLDCAGWPTGSSGSTRSGKDGYARSRRIVGPCTHLDELWRAQPGHAGAVAGGDGACVTYWNRWRPGGTGEVDGAGHRVVPSGRTRQPGAAMLVGPAGRRSAASPAAASKGRSTSWATRCS